MICVSCLCVIVVISFSLRFDLITFLESRSYYFFFLNKVNTNVWAPVIYCN